MELWKSLEILEAGSRPPPLAAADLLSRRSFLRLLGASFTLAGLASTQGACTRMPAKKILADEEENVERGKSRFYASTLSCEGIGQGILVKCLDGRPIKIEGNPRHPASLGGCTLSMQAALLEFYDPERSQSVRRQGLPSTWSAFEALMAEQAPRWRADHGRGLRLLTGRGTSPTLGAQIRAWLKLYPEARWHSYEPLGRDPQKEASLAVYGQDVVPVPRLDRAQVIVSLDGDFLGPHPAQAREARDFASRRKIFEGANPSRLYVAESTVSLTGANADHRIALKPTELPRLALALAYEVGLTALGRPDLQAYSPWIKAAARDLLDHRGRALVIAHPQGDARTQALVWLINERIQALGTTLEVLPPPEAQSGAGTPATLAELAHDLREGKVQALWTSGTNPLYTAPEGIGFGEALGRAPLRFHHGLYADETAFECQWHLPEAHALESWGDLLAYEGTLSFQQPTIEPLYAGRTATQLLALLLGNAGASSYQLLRDRHSSLSTTSFERAIRDGIVAGSQPQALNPKLRADWSNRLPPAPRGSDGRIEVTLRTDPTIGDGRFSNNAWLQEIPKIWTRLTWDNAVLISPKTAARLEIADEDEVELKIEATGRSVTAPALRVPGHPDEVVSVHLGYGRWRAGQVGNQRGFNAYRLLAAEIPSFLSGLRLSRTGRKWELARVHEYPNMEGRDIVRRGTTRQAAIDPTLIVPIEARGEPGRNAPVRAATLFQPPQSSGPAWAMAIDLSSCIGCGVCTIACQAENNIPVVGKDQVRRGREMHWIRVDRYFEGSPNHPRVFHQPVPCMHCETAPCEYVCPTEATHHSHDGLNQMVYNRCVGTRYCSNNCPYKVRRFNFMQYADNTTPVQQAMHNPEVSVRSRGVMEKCTYCVQRIQEVRITREKEGRPVADGDIQTACQQACPAEAIVFGDKNDPKTKVARWRGHALSYGLLHELGTRPRTTYLAHLRNPNPDLGEGAS